MGNRAGVAARLDCRAPSRGRPQQSKQRWADVAMGPRRILLWSLFVVLPCTPCAAQAWPFWPGTIFGGPYYERPLRRHGDESPPRRGRHQKSRPEVASGGARPVIATKAPPIVDFHYSFPVNSIVIDTGSRKLYFVLEGSRAYAYPVSVGREGFKWTGTETVSRRQPWPDWYPPVEMRERDRSLPRKMTGGVRNPLGAVALYLGDTLYRIHGTNDAGSIGRAESSGCFRLLNSAALHLASLADIGTRVTVVDSLHPHSATTN